MSTFTPNSDNLTSLDHPGTTISTSPILNNTPNIDKYPPMDLCDFLNVEKGQHMEYIPKQNEIKRLSDICERLRSSQHYSEYIQLHQELKRLQNA